MRRILGVHGIGNYSYYRDNNKSVELATAAISARWAGAINTASTEQFDVSVAYYSHHLRRGQPQSVADVNLLDEGEQDLLVLWVDQLNRVSSVSQGSRTIRARQAADWLSRRFGPPARLFALMFCREVHAYLRHRDSPRRIAAREAVQEAIRKYRPEVIIAHSLGSVIAYEALHSEPNSEVDLFMTVGSPLAMPSVVLPRLYTEMNGNIRERPSNTRSWVNLADVGDIVAVPSSGLSGSFSGVQCDLPVTIGEWDFHTSEAYLRCPEVRAQLRLF
ncbi:hypothetical protein SAMN05216377_110121 [Pseudonocardia oroxyli]|uniref:Serine peptidase n=1 Tax=Pseudonocardia oroxyli TaxID=366584 RepID=A0A1G7SWG9_PSEOR|nr:hypothetical protein SAMN05216377_110121 [Pseudonocardia oroxyli]